jgi:hypothetical protein
VKLRLIDEFSSPDFSTSAYLLNQQFDDVCENLWFLIFSRVKLRLIDEFSSPDFSTSADLLN